MIIAMGRREGYVGRRAMGIEVQGKRMRGISGMRWLDNASVLKSQREWTVGEGSVQLSGTEANAHRSHIELIEMKR